METKVQENKQKRYKNYDQQLVVSLPVLLSEVVKENALARIVNEVVDGIEMKELDSYYKLEGCPPYHPRMMIKVWLYSFCNRVYTSRKLSKKLREDLGFMWLSGMQRPCFKTLSDFRGNRMKELIDVVFKQVLSYLVIEGYVDLNDLYVDGSKWEANANKHKIVWRKNTARYKEKVLDRLDEVLKRIGELQQAEDKEYGNRDLNEKVDEGQIHVVLSSEELSIQISKVNELVEQQVEKKNQREFKSLRGQLLKEDKKLKKYEKQEKVLNGRNSYSHTDEDATGLRMKDDQLRPGYNAEITTSKQFIINGTVHQNGSDSPTLIPHVEKLKERTLGLVAFDWHPDLTADAGYGSEENYDFLEREGIMGYIKFPMWYQEHSGMLSKKLYRRENWSYNEEEAYFTCPNKKKLVFVQTKKVPTRNDYVRTLDVYECESCLGCPFFKECRGENAKPESNRRVQVSKKLEAYKEKAKTKLSSEKGVKKRAQRSVDVETPFGDIKYNMGHRRFILRGIDKVYIEFLLLAISHNLRKVYCDKTGVWREYYAQRAAKRAQKQKKRA